MCVCVLAQSWGDVYFFCGRNLQFCTCNFRWNLSGWAKAAVLWNFVLSASLGAQRCAIQLGLNGLLPGEGGGGTATHLWRWGEGGERDDGSYSSRLLVY